MPPRLQREQLQQSIGLGRKRSLLHAPQTPDQLQILQAGEVRVHLRLLRDITHRGPEAAPRLPGVASFEQHATATRLEEPGDDLHGGRLAGTIRAKISDDLAASHCKAHIVESRDTAVPLGKVLNRQHEEPPHPM